MEYEQQQQNQDDNFMNRIKESPRTVSAIIIVVIVAAAIYAFSGNKGQNEVVQSPEVSPDSSITPETSPSVSPAGTASPSITPSVAPAARTTDVAYIEVAQKGDGLTHLARRATTRYLADHKAEYTVTDEHRVYMEDYIRKHMEQGRVRVGAEKTISFDLVQKALESAGKLTPKQLKNLTKYTSALR